MTVLTLDYICDYMQQLNNPVEGDSAGNWDTKQTMSIGENCNTASSKTMGKRPGKRPGRKPSKIDERAKLERSRQSARECRARKKLRYQYLEELVNNREKAVFALRDELETYKHWCSQMDQGGPVPEALLKMIVNEEMNQRRRQMEQSRSALAQQQQQQQSQYSSSTSSSSSSSPPSGSSPPAMMKVAVPQQRPPPQQIQQVGRGQAGPSMQTLSPAQLRQYIPNLSPPLVQQNQPQQQQQQRQQQFQQLPQRPGLGGPTLQRQQAFDFSHYQPHPQQARVLPTQPAGAQTLPQQMVATTTTAITINPTTTPEDITAATKEIWIQLQKLKERKRQQQQQQQQQTFTNVSEQPVATTPQSFSPQAQVQKTQGSILPATTTDQSYMTRVRSEPPLRYTAGSNIPYSNMDVDIKPDSQGSSIQSTSEGIRARSFSNPSTMMTLPKPNLKTPPSNVRTTIPYHIPRTTDGAEYNVQSHTGSGMFSGSLVTSSLGMTTPITVEDSSSSDENLSEHNLFSVFQLNAQKRTLSDPMLPENPKRSKVQSTTEAPLTSMASQDPHATLSNLTSVHCFSATNTSNTPSPAPYGLVPAGIPSPASSRYSGGKLSPAPSSSTNPSPAPLSSMSSILELSASSPAQSTPLSEITVDDVIAVTSRSPVQYSSTELSSSFTEPIPDWYSYLADLEDPGMPTLNTRREVTSSHSTPMALTPAQQDQPATPNPSHMNVPTIIDELLDREDPAL